MKATGTKFPEMVTKMGTQERDKTRRKLDALATWPATEIDEEFQKWKPEEIQKLWKLLKTPYRQMCRAFGKATQRQRVSLRGTKTHQQIKRLMVLQKHAQKDEPHKEEENTTASQDTHEKEEPQ